LLPEKALFDVATKTLVVSDVHLGKAPYFQQSGLAVPAQMGAQDLDLLALLCSQLQPQKLVFLGDLFHATKNSDWEILRHFCLMAPDIQKILVRGNHDYFSEAAYQQIGLEVVDQLALGAAVLLHESLGTHEFEVAGHVHPGIVLRGPGKQSLRLPCFAMAPRTLLLPAFGKFTGLAVQKPTKKWVYYPIGEGVVFEGWGG
jgi:DNA ligase-associated metallophosphoesterase